MTREAIIAIYKSGLEPIIALVLRLFRKIAGLEETIAGLREIISSYEKEVESGREQTQLLKEQKQVLKDEIDRLKKHSPRPKIKPSTLEDEPKETEGNKEENQSDQKRPGSAKRSKTKELDIHETTPIAPDHIPPGSEFKGYQDYTVQDIIIKVHNTRYRLERYKTPDGQYIIGKLPDEVADGHFGPTLVCYILYQYHHLHVTQPLLLEQLHEFRIDISAGKLNRIITEGKERFHAEKDEIIRTGLAVSEYLNVDDTTARHNGKNGYCTHIGNEFFAWFASTDSKSRINFLELLRGERNDYIITSEALDYMREFKLKSTLLEKLAEQEGTTFQTQKEWKKNLKALGITKKRHAQIATEAALIGSLLEGGFNTDIAIISDDAGQFNVLFLLHALCWIHAERTINKLMPASDRQHKALEEIRSKIWDFYQELKKYKQSPNEENKSELEAEFDKIFTAKTSYETLNQALKRLHKNKAELLLVLDRPDIPLHNNSSENAIRDYAKKRKISGSTRSDDGRRCRDTFASLKKTCRKLGISFWEYLKDRIFNRNAIPQLPELIRQRAEEAKS